MKTKRLVNLLVLLIVTMGGPGCVIHEHAHSGPHHPRHHPPQFHAHAHGPGCGHMLRGGVWIAIP